MSRPALSSAVRTRVTTQNDGSVPTQPSGWSTPPPSIPAGWSIANRCRPARPLVFGTASWDLFDVTRDLHVEAAA